MNKQLFRAVLTLVATLLLFVPLAKTVSTDGPRDREFDQRTGHKLGKRAVIVSDDFDGREEALLKGRKPRTAPRSSAWEVELGNWMLRDSGLVETSPEDWSAASDKRAYISVNRTDVDVSARVTHDGDSQFVGLVTRYSGPLDWLMFWYDGHGELVLGAKKPGSGQDFWDLKRVPFEWESGSSHTLTLRVRGDEITAFLDKHMVMSLDSVEVIGDATSAGIFSRGAGDARFERFTVSGQERLRRHPNR